MLDFVPGQIDQLLTKAIGALANSLRNAVSGAFGGTSSTLFDGIIGASFAFQYNGQNYVLWVASKNGQAPQVLVATAGKIIGPLTTSSFSTGDAKTLLTTLINAAKALVAATKSKNTKLTDLPPLETTLTAAEKNVADLAVLAENACVALNAGCFAAGTKLRTPNGWMAVETIEVGQLVLARHEDEAHGETAWKAVEAKFDRTGRILHLHVNGQLIRTTPEHPFFVFGKAWTAAGAIAAGDWVSTEAGGWAAVEEIFDTGEYETVYNVRVAEYHTYFVGDEGWESGVWVHNSACAVVDSKTPSILYNYTRGSYMQVQLAGQGASPAYSQTWWIPTSMKPVPGKPNNPAIAAAATIDQTTNIGNILQTQTQLIANGWSGQSTAVRYGGYQNAIQMLLDNINALLPSGTMPFTLDGIDQGTQTLATNPNIAGFNSAVNQFYQQRGFYIGTSIHNQLAQWLQINPIAGLSYNGPNRGPDFVYTTTNASGHTYTIYFEVLTGSRLSLSVHADKPYSGNLWRAVIYNFPTTQGYGP